MRITNRMINNNYLSNLNNSLEELTNLNDKVSSGRSYTKASEDPAASLKAFQVRKNLSRISLYQSNVSEADSVMTDVETAVTELNSIVTSISEKIEQGRSDTYSEDDRKNFAEILHNYQAEIFDISNYKSADKYVFGGSDMMDAPFVLTSGTLSYHGTDVNSNTGFTAESAIYYDIGMGLETDASGQVKEGTAFNISYPGSEVFGTGTDTNGVSNNIYNLVGQIRDAFEANDMTNMDNYVSKLESFAQDVTVNLVDVGQKSDFLGFLTDRLENNEFDATKKQASIETIDTAKGIVDYNTQETAYEAALAMGSKILQYTLLDYMS